jgi:hypothetical protein
LDELVEPVSKKIRSSSKCISANATMEFLRQRAILISSAVDWVKVPRDALAVTGQLPGKADFSLLILESRFDYFRIATTRPDDEPILAS